MQHEPISETQEGYTQHWHLACCPYNQYNNASTVGKARRKS